MFPCWAFFFLCFWQNVYQSALSPQNLPCSEKFVFVCLRHYSFCKRLHLKCLTVFWIYFCLDNCSVICAMTLCYILHRLHQMHSELCLFSYICGHIQAYAALLRHFQAYSGIFSTLCIFDISKTLPSPGIFRTRGMFKTMWNCDLANLGLWHSGNIFHFLLYKKTILFSFFCFFFAWASIFLIFFLIFRSLFSLIYLIMSMILLIMEIKILNKKS